MTQQHAPKSYQASPGIADSSVSHVMGEGGTLTSFVPSHSDWGTTQDLHSAFSTCSVASASQARLFCHQPPYVGIASSESHCEVFLFLVYR